MFLDILKQGFHLNGTYKLVSNSQNIYCCSATKTSLLMFFREIQLLPSLRIELCITRDVLSLIRVTILLVTFSTNLINKMEWRNPEIIINKDMFSFQQFQLWLPYNEK
jgi:hypothetical protein